MSTPSDKGSSSATSPLTKSEEIADTASSVQGVGAPPEITFQEVKMFEPPTSPQRVSTAAPNVMFKQRMRDTRARSVLQRPHRAVLPALSIAQLCVRTAERKADTALSSVGQIAEQTLRAQSTADDAIAEARAVHKEVESRISAMA